MLLSMSRHRTHRTIRLPRTRATFSDSWTRMGPGRVRRIRVGPRCGRKTRWRRVRVVGVADGWPRRQWCTSGSLGDVVGAPVLSGCHVSLSIRSPRGWSWPPSGLRQRRGRQSRDSSAHDSPRRTTKRPVGRHPIGWRRDDLVVVEPTKFPTISSSSVKGDAPNSTTRAGRVHNIAQM